jgi:hypothetical protein
VACRLVECVVRLAWKDRVRRRKDSNVSITTVNDVVSFLPGHPITRSAMYWTLLATTIKREDPSFDVVLPDEVDSFIEKPKDRGLIGHLALYFRGAQRPESTTAMPPNTVFVLPPDSLPQALAICTVDQSSCSTLARRNQRCST